MADDLDLETISMLLMSEEGHMLSSPPMWFKIKEILQDMKVPSSVVESSEGAAKSKNEVIDNLLKMMSKSSYLEVFCGLSAIRL